jgi:hypothetical protein
MEAEDPRSTDERPETASRDLVAMVVLERRTNGLEISDELGRGCVWFRRNRGLPWRTLTVQ